MRALSILLLLFFFSKNINACESSNEPEIYAVNETPFQLNDEAQLRAVNDLWSRIKNRALVAWESLRALVDRASDRISQWTDKIKRMSVKLNEFVKKRIEDMKRELDDLIDNAKHTSDLVKQCLQNEKTTIDAIVKRLIQQVTECISQNIQKLAILEKTSTEFYADKTEFIAKVEGKLTLCLNNDNIEQCFETVRKSVYDELEVEEKEIFNTKDEFRARSDDILDTIATCASNGLIGASASITNTTINIIRCVSQGSSDSY